MKWDGEWHITYEVFRDLGIAFAVVLVLIFVLVVGWFQSFSTPVVIMAAIPFSLIGILPAHWAMAAFFTATSMIGFIAGAGIVVRTSIILVDFIELRLAEGAPLDQAVIDAGAGTGRVAFSVAPFAGHVFAVEPVGTLRRFMRERAVELGIGNVFVLDGLLRDIPLPTGSADVLLTCQAIGWALADELAEIERVLDRAALERIAADNR